MRGSRCPPQQITGVAQMSRDTARESELPSADPLVELEWHYIKATAFSTALELHVWDVVASEPKSARRIAAENAWDVAGTQRLLDALCGMKLLTKEGHDYHLVPISKTYLVSDSPGYMGDPLLVNMSWAGKAKLADAIRTGTRPIITDWTSGSLSPFWASNESPSRLSPERAIAGKEALWQLLGIQAAEGLRVLDVACGSAGATLALAKLNPGVSLTLNDWPPVVEGAMAIAEALGLGPQISSLPGGIHTVDFGTGQYDLIWIGDFLHFWGPEQVVEILKRLHQALAPGGTLVVKESVVDEGRREDPWLAASLWLFGVSAEGDLYTPSEWLMFMKQAGFLNPVPVSKGDELPIWFKATK